MMTQGERQPFLANDSTADRGKGLYYVHTLGCQMNVHDSERIAGLLEEEGYRPASREQLAAQDVDLMVLNTCAVRENASQRMYGTIGEWAKLKRHNPQAQIAVGGCMAQKDRDRIAQRAPWVDAVFGTKNIEVLPQLLNRARQQRQSQVEVSDQLEAFPSALPAVRGSRTSAWVSISVGCNNTCTFCIVPAVRGRERDRPIEDVLAEVRRCVNDGAKEVTLLGQNVNSYGYSMGDRYAFGRLLRACGQIEGLERVRFTSPHPAAFSDDVIEAMAQTPNVMHQLHMPLQSGSDRILRAMRRSYRSQRFLSILERVRQAMPDAQITTDIIVGFPGESEADFQETCQLVSQARFSSAYIFQYSPRPGTPAALMEQVPKEVVQERFERLVDLQEQITHEQLNAFVGKQVEVLVSGQEGRRDQQRHRMSGRERSGTLVHLRAPEGLKAPQVGDLVTCTVTQAGKHFLLADPDPSKGEVYAVHH